ncbi:hypothetical protein WMY93_032547 [Mugilogobius chulae]|uniref:Uncharacterized protein n=1 Tax=Mugilogobius chulae TaxID=88201 RepID=A0AAW0MKY7_9GOBI
MDTARLGSERKTRLRRTRRKVCRKHKMEEKHHSSTDLKQVCEASNQRPELRRCAVIGRGLTVFVE